MKTRLSLFALFAAFACCSAWAAPSVSTKDVSDEALKEVATDRQKASLDLHEKAKAKAVEERSKAIKEAQEITEKNDEGLKKTIQRHHLNSMLPPCDREPETPREPGNYRIRY